MLMLLQGLLINPSRLKHADQFTLSNLLDPSDYSDAKAIDPPFPMRYECVCLTISVEALEDLANNEFPPGSAEFFQRAKAQLQPFSRISRIRSRSQMDTIDIATIRGIPYVAVAKRPETILFKNLDTGVTSSLRIARMWGFDNIVCFHLSIKFATSNMIMNIGTYNP